MEEAQKRIREYSPNSLDPLDISYLNLNVLPKIPNYVKNLNCSHNNLIYIDKLPSKLEYLNCSDNQLIFISKLPKSLKYINVKNNNDIVLPSFSKDMVVIRGTDIKNKTKRIYNGMCFNTNINSVSDINGFLLSSKNNIIINYSNQLLCFDRDDFKIHNAIKHEIKNETYYTYPLNKTLGNLIINKKTLNSLLNTRYSIYNFIYQNSIYNLFDNYRVEAFKKEVINSIY